MLTLEDFIISDSALEKVKNEQLLKQHLENEKPLQEIFGFSVNVMAEFYDSAKNILEQNRFNDAIKAFSFLTVLNPYMADFWVGLGVAQQNANEIENAVYSFKMACKREGNTITPYMLAAQSLLQIHEYEQAIQVMEEAEQYADAHMEDEKCKQLKLDIPSAKLYIKGKKI